MKSNQYKLRHDFVIGGHKLKLSKITNESEWTREEAIEQIKEVCALAKVMLSVYGYTYDFKKELNYGELLDLLSDDTKQAIAFQHAATFHEEFSGNNIEDVLSYLISLVSHA